MCTQASEDSDEQVVVIGNVSITINGKTYEQPIHKAEFVYADLMEAVRNGNDPARALLWLADAGSKAILGDGIKPENWRIGRFYAIGPTPPRS